MPEPLETIRLLGMWVPPKHRAEFGAAVEALEAALAAGERERQQGCPAGDECALNSGAVHCFHCRRNWPRDETWDQPFIERPDYRRLHSETLRAELDALVRERQQLRDALERAKRIEVLAASAAAREKEAIFYLVERMSLDRLHAGLTGISSDALVVAAFTGETPSAGSYPLDRADWRRCLVAYALAPLWLRERMRPTMRSYRALLDRRYWSWGCIHPRPTEIRRLAGVR